jgi:hypothetical protein
MRWSQLQGRQAGRGEEERGGRLGGGGRAAGQRGGVGKKCLLSQAIEGPIALEMA